MPYTSSDSAEPLSNPKLSQGNRPAKQDDACMSANFLRFNVIAGFKGKMMAAENGFPWCFSDRAVLFGHQGIRAHGQSFQVLVTSYQ
jgi:hypothetical protein